jgi:23S rRNA pseudouridine1911/1915/1917 synthase
LRAPVDVLYEDRDILVVDKPAGVLTIPSSPRALGEDTILRRARAYVASRQRRRGRGYVGLLHRLDRNTSGAMAIALSREAHARGRELFKHHRFERRYLAIVRGVPDPRAGVISARISSAYVSGRRRVVAGDEPGLEAATDYVVREVLRDASLVELTLHTGRQHQIRLHLQSIGHPIVGERVYGGGLEPGAGRREPRDVVRPMLHAWALAFPHPITGARVAVNAPLPHDFESVLTRLRLEASG